MFKERKEALGLSYNEIGKLFDPPINRGTAYQFIVNPGRFKKQTIIRLAKALNIPEDEALEYWKPIRHKYLVDKIDI